jgi:hypothetical protein
MISSSPLRQLSREYYEGKINRADYVQQRRHQLVSLVGGQVGQRAVRGAFITDQDSLLEGSQPDYNDLTNALAGGGNELPGFPAAASDLPVFGNSKTEYGSAYGGAAPASANTSVGFKPGEEGAHEPVLSSANSGESGSVTGTVFPLIGKLLLVVSLLFSVVWLIWQAL